MRKIFTACLGTETNTFAAIPTGLQLFQETCLFRKGSYGKDATREVVLKSMNLQHTKVSWETFSRITWDNIGSSKDIEGDACLFKYMGGKLVGGKFDAIKRDQRTKGLDNVLAPEGNYLGTDWHMIPGETVYFCVIGKRNGQPVRSNVLEARYP